MNPDHDTLSELFKQSPEAFDEYTKGLVQEFINSAPEGLRLALKQQQWKIDGLKYKYKDPLVLTAKITEMMFDSLYALNVELTKLTESWEGRND